MSDVTLSAGVRQNLLSLQNTAAMMSKTQNRLATGKKVNSALDNPTNFFTSAALNSRANDLSALLDSMSNGMKTLEAADNGLSAITNTIESMQATARQARQDKSFNATSYALDETTLQAATTQQSINFTGGEVGATGVSIDLLATVGNGTDTSTAAVVTADNAYTDLDVADGDETYGFDVSDGTNSHTVSLTVADDTNADGSIDIDEFAAAANTQLAANNVAVTVGDDGGGKLTFTADVAGSSTVTVDAFTAGGTTPSANTAPGFADPVAGGNATGTDATVLKTVDELVTEINAHADLIGKVSASNDNGQLRIKNISTTDMTTTGVGTNGIDGSTGTSDTGGNTVRRNLINQFNELRNQLDKLADDSSYNGINLLAGDNLKLTFNETATSTIDIQAKDADGNVRAINTANLGIGVADASEFSSDSAIDSRLESLRDSLVTLRSQASAFGSNLSIVENRNNFTAEMINTLTIGADNLVLADSNEEGANMLALQTRQQLSTTALSLASQADQAVLRLF